MQDPDEQTKATEDELQEDAQVEVVADGGGNGNDNTPGSAPPRDPLAAAQAEAAELREKLLRAAADFDNFRKRSRREIQEAEKKGRDGLLRDMLPVFDNLERAAEHAEKSSGNLEADWKGLSEGITLVMRQFRDTLERVGIERVDAVGHAFDPSVHEAIQHMETHEHPPGAVAAEVQAGYREGEKLVRPALVVVAKSPQGASSTEDSTNGQTSSGSSKSV